MSFTIGILSKMAAKPKATKSSSSDTSLSTASNGMSLIHGIRQGLTQMEALIRSHGDSCEVQLNIAHDEISLLKGKLAESRQICEDLTNENAWLYSLLTMECPATPDKTSPEAGISSSLLDDTPQKATNVPAKASSDPGQTATTTKRRTIKRTNNTGNGETPAKQVPTGRQAKKDGGKIPKRRGITMD